MSQTKPIEGAESKKMDGEVVDDDGSVVTSSMFTTLGLEFLEDYDGDVENLGVRDQDGYIASSDDENRGTSASGSKDTGDDVVVNLKGNKRRKKGGKIVREEDDLDKILAELGVASPSASADNNVLIDQTEANVAAGNGVVSEIEEGNSEMSAAAKKKRKKKERKKEKKAAAAAAAASSAEEKHEEIINQVAGEEKKVSKHVKNMQKRLAKIKAEAERKNREEEERLKKEEQERLEQEKLVREAEERKRLKKEKRLRKKQEGKILTGKQKEEARRLEAMRNQFLASAGGLPLTSTALKRPEYQTKKSNPHSQENGCTSSNTNEITEANKKQEAMPCLDSLETEEVEEMNLMDVKGEPDVVEEDVTEEDDDEEWDAKGLDDYDLDILGKYIEFDDEQTELEPKSVLNNGIKSSPTVTCYTKPSMFTEKVSSTALVEFQDNIKSLLIGDVAADSKQRAIAEKKVSQKADSENLRSPICCIMGHVDAGKTKLLDCIRGTNVQENEAGGITQQIGATYFPAEILKDKTRELKPDAALKVPGLLIIDTPGHESFINLRSRGSGLCDIAILVVDIMDGLKPQTVESLKLLKMRKTPFIVALNKVDRLYGWKTCQNAPFVKAKNQQCKDVQNEFNKRLTEIIGNFKEQGWNSDLYYKIKNKDMGETISIVPTSAISGEGIPDMLLLLVKWCQKTMVDKLTYSEKLQCTVLEVKASEGDGTTIDVVLVNGVLHEGDQIVVCGMQGPIVTTIRALSTPHPMKELRVKGTYLHHKEIKAAQFIKIAAQDLKHAIAGTNIFVVGPDDDLEVIKKLTMGDKKTVMDRTDKTGKGICVQAPTLGSLEALLDFLKTPEVNIPVGGIGIGPVHKKDVMKARVMLEKKKKEYATILAFDVKVSPDAWELADKYGVRIFIADTIYSLIHQFKAYLNTHKEEKKKEVADETVFPCVLKIIPGRVFNKKDPIILGVDVLEGIAKVGTPICISQKEFIDIGRITHIRNNEQPVDLAKKGSAVSIKITGSNSLEKQMMFGRQFNTEDLLVSHLSGRSIDILKELYWDELSDNLRKLVVNLKKLFKIQ
ncbi:hypothetical protein DCAR_0417528 [Daucus carota subsp. sativus]|uniref:Eukaryotic translation initiation factor 5B n=2 Tax=Daucus carota subsp. sativus TaxID=79200 RepID=A0AAF0WYI8_DAUCS|nr:PREDICTED: eukaryotic translation initiation factor 5B-like [Daucus carota subsp. sativus]XP_017247633.1 PREDICTED: eukaryotic translation initiation factor 5B-like [Daucus carota subsp. sativus]WOG98187.1 hypothetical protein DCAR_0417528 [Daucus carota subsp. sativus]